MWGAGGEACGKQYRYKPFHSDDSAYKYTCTAYRGADRINSHSSACVQHDSACD